MVQSLEMSEYERSRILTEEDQFSTDEEIIERSSSVPQRPFSPEGWRVLRSLETNNLLLIVAK